MVVVFVANTAWSIFNFRISIIKKIVSLGGRVVVVSPPDEYSEKLRSCGCSVVDFPMNARGINPFSDIFIMVRLFLLYKKLMPDLVFHYTIKPNIYGSIASYLSGVQSIAVTTGLGYAFIVEGIISKIVKLLYRFAFKFPLKIVFLNRDDRDVFISEGLVSIDKVVTFPSEGIDLNYFAPVSSLVSSGSVCTFLLIARILRDKGVYEYLHAAAKVKEQYPSAVFQLLGGYSLSVKNSIGREEIEHWCESGILEYLGTEDDVRSAISQADCVVLPSYREGVPRCLLEAAAMGKPIIATDVAGCREVVIENETGFLCSVKDSKALADCFIRMIKLSSHDRRTMGMAGRAHVQNNFSEEKVINQYIDLLTHHGLSSLNRIDIE